MMKGMKYFDWYLKAIYVWTMARMMKTAVKMAAAGIDGVYR